MTAHADPLTWEADLPLFSRVMLAQWTGAMVATWLMVAVIMTPVFISTGEADNLGTTLLFMAGGVAILWVLGWLVMAVVFRGRSRVRYELTDRGLRLETVDRVVKAGNRAALVAGALAGKPGLAGVGLLGASREVEEIRWAGTLRAVPQPARSTILVKNAWRTVMWVQCPPDRYEQIAAAINDRLAVYRTEVQAVRGSPLPAYIGRTLLMSLACFPLFPLAEEIRTGLFLPIFVYCFALATVWMIPLLGYAVIGGLGIEAVLVLTRLDAIGHGDETVLAVAGLGAAVLLWMSWRFLRGRTQSAWMAEMGDRAGD